MKKIILLCLSLLLIGACATPSGSRYREGDNIGQEAALTVQDENRMAKEALPQLQKEYPPVKNPELQKYISSLGMKIVTANKLEGNPYNYHFTVVDVPTVNAFALPAGEIFVTAPLIAMAASEAELAGVIGHEVGHVMARHTAERMYVMEKEQGKTWLYTIGGGIIGAAAGFGLGKVLCDEGDKDCLAKAALLGGVAGAGGGLLVQKFKFMANSREDEMEADRIGFKLAVGAGYNKDHVGKFYEKLLQMEKKAKAGGNPLTQSLSDALSTHPPSEERLKQLNELAFNAPPAPKSTITSADFTRIKQIAAGMKKK